MNGKNVTKVITLKSWMSGTTISGRRWREKRVNIVKLMLRSCEKLSTQSIQGFKCWVSPSGIRPLSLFHPFNLICYRDGWDLSSIDYYLLNYNFFRLLIPMRVNMVLNILHQLQKLNHFSHSIYTPSIRHIIIIYMYVYVYKKQKKCYDNGLYLMTFLTRAFLHSFSALILGVYIANFPHHNFSFSM